MRYFIIIVCSIWVVFLLWIGDVIPIPLYSVKVNKSCDFVLPKQYSLVQKAVLGKIKYAVAFTILEGSPNYLYYKEYKTITPFLSDMGSASEAALFPDTCTAKGFAKMVIENNASHASENFTPVNSGK
jgi:hypothetical protein